MYRAYAHPITGPDPREDRERITAAAARTMAEAGSFLDPPTGTGAFSGGGLEEQVTGIGCGSTQPPSARTRTDDDQDPAPGQPRRVGARERRHDALRRRHLPSCRHA